MCPRKPEADPAEERDCRSKWWAFTNGTASSMSCEDINLKVTRGEEIVVCGPSGSGKSTDDPLHQPAGRTPEGFHRRRWHRADQTISRRSMRSAAKSAWCSSTSISSRT